MVRPKHCRCVAQEPNAVYFKPQGIPMRELEEIHMSLDEIEALRLCDMEGLYQETAAEHMGISRATISRILESARQKTAVFLVLGNALRIEGGTITMTGQRKFQCNECGHTWKVPFGTLRPEACPACGETNIHRFKEKGTNGRGKQIQRRRRQRACGNSRANAAKASKKGE